MRNEDTEGETAGWAGQNVQCVKGAMKIVYTEVELPVDKRRRRLDMRGMRVD